MLGQPRGKAYNRLLKGKQSEIRAVFQDLCTISQPMFLREGGFETRPYMYHDLSNDHQV
jgi:hypothetical protein